jgi:hypothetical protein
LLDPEVGYCQGLSFPAGLLFMHLEEEQAFLLFSHLLLQERLRAMFHPDMTGLQLALYQLARLLADLHPALYSHLDRLQLDPSLYATPWLVTIFAAHFPLGFVVRVLDLVFLEGPTAILKVAVCLLAAVEAQLVAAAGLERAMAVLRSDLPGLGAARLEGIMQEASSLRLGRQLEGYRAEYALLREEQPKEEAAGRVEQLEREGQEGSDHRWS